MQRTLIAACLGGLLCASGAAAEGTRTLKFEGISASPGTGSGATSCTISMQGGTQKFRPPARVEVTVGGDGTAAISGLNCTQNGVTRKLSKIPGAKTTVVVIDFSASGTEFWFERSDGGSVGHMSGGRFIGG